MEPISLSIMENSIFSWLNSSRKKRTGEKIYCIKNSFEENYGFTKKELFFEIKLFQFSPQFPLWILINLKKFSLLLFILCFSVGLYKGKS